jgi:hypothetical protein
MICLRCGQCCIDTAVVLVKPEFVSENYDSKNPPKGTIFIKDTIDPCPYLSWESETKTKCNIHHYKWYKYTPCYRHHQRDAKNSTLCKLGVYNLEQKIDVRKKCKELKENREKGWAEIRKILKMGFTLDEFNLLPEEERNKLLDGKE